MPLTSGLEPTGGLEPPTYALQVRCAASCATSAGPDAPSRTNRSPQGQNLSQAATHSVRDADKPTSGRTGTLGTQCSDVYVDSIALGLPAARLLLGSSGTFLPVKGCTASWQQSRTAMPRGSTQGVRPRTSTPARSTSTTATSPTCHPSPATSRWSSRTTLCTRI